MIDLLQWQWEILISFLLVRLRNQPYLVYWKSMTQQIIFYAFIHIDGCRCYSILFLEIKSSITGSGIDVVGNSSKRMRDAIWDVYDAVVLSDNSRDTLLRIQPQKEWVWESSAGKLQRQRWYIEGIAGDKRRAPWFEERQLTNKRLQGEQPRSRFLITRIKCLSIMFSGSF